MKNRVANKLLTAGWVWIYNHMIKEPQTVADLYVECVDDINNALQCSNCGNIHIPEDVPCPDCHGVGHFEMVWAPGIEEDEHASRYVYLTTEEREAIEEGAGVCTEHHYIQWADDPPCPQCHPNDDLKLPLKPEWAAHLYQSELESYVAGWSNAELEAYNEFMLAPECPEGITHYPRMERTFEGEDVFLTVKAELSKRGLPTAPRVGPITPAEYAQVLVGREQQKAAQAWEEAKQHHNPEACGKYIDCQMCVEIEHDRTIESGEISVE